MALLKFIPAAQAISQIDTITMTGTFAAADTVTVNVASKKVVYTCGASETVTTVAAGVLALCQASAEPEFKEITWTSALGVITATSTAGIPVTITASDTAAAGTATKANTQTATGPKWWSNTANWSTGSVPTTSDSVEIDLHAEILYGLPTSLTLTRFVMTGGTLGLLDWNASGYAEYRTRRAVFTCTDVVLGTTPSVGPDLCRIDLASAAAVVTVYGSKKRSDNLVAVDLLLNNASASVNVMGGQVGICLSTDTTTTVGTVNVAKGATVTIGSPTIITTLLSSGTTQLFSPITTLTVDDGTTTLMNSATVTTLTVRSGTFVHKSNGTITTAVVGPGTIDLSQDMRTKTITSLQLNLSGIMLKPYPTVTITNGVTLNADADRLTAS